jgi:hypothetical protein
MSATRFAARPGFYFLLASNRIPDVFEYFEINQAIDVVLAGKTRKRLGLMLKHPLLKVTCNPCVQSARWIGEDVDVVTLVAPHGLLASPYPVSEAFHLQS